jgi:hypothetical protein
MLLRGPQEWAALSGGEWDGLGLKLEAVGAEVAGKVFPGLRGGMRILAIHPHGPVGQLNVRVGDLLVGLHQWEMLSAENVRFALDSCRKAGMRSTRVVVAHKGHVLQYQIPLPR